MAAIKIEYGYSELDKRMYFFINTSDIYTFGFEKWIWFYMGKNNLSKSNLINKFCRIFPFSDNGINLKIKEIEIVADAEKTANTIMKFIAHKAELKYNKLNK